MKKLTDIGKVLITLKIANDEKITDQAEKLGVNSSYVSSIMYGRSKLSFNVGQKIFNNYALTEQQTKVLLSAVFNKCVVVSCEDF